MRDRPALLLPAAIILVPLSFVSFALVTLPLLIPAGMLFAGYVRRSAGGPPARGTAGGTTLVVLVGLVLAFVVLLFHQDARSWTTANGGGSTSDVITYAESLACLGVVALAAAAGWVLAEPRRAD